jgi:hypothetical protein
MTQFHPSTKLFFWSLRKGSRDWELEFRKAIASLIPRGIKDEKD